MSEASSTAAQTGTSTAARSIITNADSPISQLIPYVTTWFKYFITSSRPALLFWPLPIFLYLFAPIIVFFDVVVAVFFYGPYQIILYLLDALYPLYVLVGVACITGCVLGLAGRLLCRSLVYLVQDETRDLKGKAKDET